MSAPATHRTPPPPPSQPTPTRSGAALTLLDVRKEYAGPAAPVHALRGVSLSLAPGSFTAVMGPSGSGKSTLLHCAAGLDVPTSGQVHVGGHDISRLTPDRLARFRRDHVGFVFQAYNLVPHLSVADNVALPVILAGREPDLAWMAHLLGSVGLSGMEGRRPGDLSGGQAQRVAIARALFSRPTLVFADEPTGALDVRTGTEVLGVLRDTAAQLGQTLVVVTHDATVAAAAEQVLLLADGQVVDRIDAPTAQLVADRMLGLER
ncbi:ABC transporter ATP-binding protein [Nocardioides jishulii]|uniref:ABC transporter ATP-binding protein n=1 Tax=Nocardioides jishulii TaxID=2575440 RepID=A0A4U2YID0_9ACTN|nr:ABC transporter ATP-binding protein [Nocardioides jishulii]QCX28164.1 ABC transporter ATP-binding protein [Nocardioides jishulii]TKI60828.1 ABC transporter ATP-binding protein [Nocardioides jishulii]